MFCLAAAETKLPDTYRLMKTGLTIRGEVTNKQAANHQTVNYSFVVDGKTYTWGGHAGDIGKEFSQISIGQQVPVTYEPDNPTNSCLGDPDVIFYPDLRLSIFASLFPTVMLIFLAFKYIPELKNAKP